MIEKEKAKVMVDFGGDITELISDDADLKNAVKKIVDASVLSKAKALELDPMEIEQLEMLKV